MSPVLDSLTRTFCSADVPCKGGCLYCFTKWPSYGTKTQTNVNILTPANLDCGYIVYPCCDGDFFSEDDSVIRLQQKLESYSISYVSISTKLKPTSKQLQMLADLNNMLETERRGFVKFAISISCKSMLAEIEPDTMSYQERLELARNARERGLKTALTIKPMLPFITAQEYLSILADFKPYIKHVLLGGLYVDTSSSFFMKYCATYHASERTVTWLPSSPLWMYIEDTELTREIKVGASELDLHTFDNDMQLVQSMRVGL